MKRECTWRNGSRKKGVRPLLGFQLCDLRLNGVDFRLEVRDFIGLIRLQPRGRKKLLRFLQLLSEDF